MPAHRRQRSNEQRTALDRLYDDDDYESSVWGGSSDEEDKAKRKPVAAASTPRKNGRRSAVVSSRTSNMQSVEKMKSARTTHTTHSLPRTASAATATPLTHTTSTAGKTSVSLRPKAAELQEAVPVTAVDYGESVCITNNTLQRSSKTAATTSSTSTSTSLRISVGRNGERRIAAATTSVARHAPRLRQPFDLDDDVANDYDIAVGTIEEERELAKGKNDYAVNNYRSRHRGDFKDSESSASESNDENVRRRGSREIARDTIVSIHERLRDTRERTRDTAVSVHERLRDTRERTRDTAISIHERLRDNRPQSRNHLPHTSGRQLSIHARLRDTRGHRRPQFQPRSYSAQPWGGVRGPMSMVNKVQVAPTVQELRELARHLPPPATDVRFFFVKTPDPGNISVSQTNEVWITTKAVTEKLDRAFKTTDHVIVFSDARDSGRAIDGFFKLKSGAEPVPWEISEAWKGCPGTTRGFHVGWISTEHLPYSLAQDVLNPYNAYRSVVDCLDGMEISRENADELMDCYKKLNEDRKMELEARAMMLNPESNKVRGDEDEFYEVPRALRIERSKRAQLLALRQRAMREEAHSVYSTAQSEANSQHDSGNPNEEVEQIEEQNTVAVEMQGSMDIVAEQENVQEQIEEETAEENTVDDAGNEHMPLEDMQMGDAPMDF